MNKTAVTAKILIVDHYQVGQRTALMQLQYLGFEADVVTSCRQAIRAIKERSYALVLLGWGMNVCDGHSLTKYIRKFDDERNRHTPIIGVTVHAQPGDRERCLLSGLDGLISKPITVTNMQTILQLHTKNAA